MGPSDFGWWPSIHDKYADPAYRRKWGMDRQTMPEASRLTPERLRGVFVEVPITTRSVADYAQELYPRLCAYGDAWAADLEEARYWRGMAECSAREALQDPRRCGCMLPGGNIPEPLQAACVFHAILGRPEFPGFPLPPASFADSGKEIAELKEQLRAYRGAERIAHDQLDGRLVDA